MAEAAEGAVEAVLDGAVEAVVGALGGRVSIEVAEGEGAVAIVEVHGPGDVAGAETGDVVGPLGGEDDIDDELAEGGVGVRGGAEAAEVDGMGEPVGGHRLHGRVVAPVIGSFGADGCEGGLHGGLPEAAGGGLVDAVQGLPNAAEIAVGLGAGVAEGLLGGEFGVGEVLPGGAVDFGEFGVGVRAVVLDLEIDGGSAEEFEAAVLPGVGGEDVAEEGGEVLVVA